jgi:hypothetical protein
MASIEERLEYLENLVANKITSKPGAFFSQSVNTYNAIIPTHVMRDIDSLPADPATPGAAHTVVTDAVLTIVPGSANTFVNGTIKNLINPLLIGNNAYDWSVKDGSDIEIPYGQNGMQLDFESGSVRFIDGIVGLDVTTTIKLSAVQYVGTFGVGGDAGDQDINTDSNVTFNTVNVTNPTTTDSSILTHGQGNAKFLTSLSGTELIISEASGHWSITSVAGVLTYTWVAV